MPKQTTQAPPKMDANNAAAALALATHISQPQAPQAPPDASQTPKTTQGEPQAPLQATSVDPNKPVQADPKIAELEGKMDSMKLEIENMIKDQVGGIKELVTQALQDGQG